MIAENKYKTKQIELIDRGADADYYHWLGAQEPCIQEEWQWVPL
jgi:hypothetical protein